VRAPCLPRSRQSCCRGTDLGGAFERCDHLCCGRSLQPSRNMPQCRP
jgi:hypothetical protein